jgi:hypothetical protein
MATDRDAAYHDAARRMRDLVEPLAAAVYFAPEAQQRYEALGLNYVEAYFGSRSACLGTVPWRVVSGVFAAFKPSVVERAMAGVHAKTDPQALLEARLAGARDQIVRMAGAPTDDFLVAADLLLEVTDGLDGSGRALYSALAGLPVPGRDDPAGRLWRAADLVREHRGDGHIAAWLPHFDSAEVTVLTEPWWGIEPGSYAWTRGWDADDIASARARLVDRGLLDEHHRGGPRPARAGRGHHRPRRPRGDRAPGRPDRRAVHHARPVVEGDAGPGRLSGAPIRAVRLTAGGRADTAGITLRHRAWRYGCVDPRLAMCSIAAIRRSERRWLRILGP